MGLVWIAALAFVTFCTAAIGSGTNNIARVCAPIFFISAIALYLSPAIVAFRREHRSAAGIAVLNVLLGWTLLGWIGALVWAYTPAQSSTPTPASGTAEPAAPTADTKTCPFCAETIRAEAIKCRFCGSEVAVPVEA